MDCYAESITTHSKYFIITSSIPEHHDTVMQVFSGSSY